MAGIIGIPGRLRSKSVAAFVRNPRPASIGIGGRLRRNPPPNSSESARADGASRKSPRSCRAISSDGAPTSASAKPLQCCAISTSGPGGGCVPSPGSSGSVGAPALRGCDAAASAGIWRRKPPVAHMVPGGSATARRSPSPCQMPSSPRLASQPWQPNVSPSSPNRRIRTRTYGGVGGAEPRGSPLSRFPLAESLDAAHGGSNRPVRARLRRRTRSGVGPKGNIAEGPVGLTSPLRPYRLAECAFNNPWRNS